MFQIREGLVCRDIAGVYFLVDIHDKYSYRSKQLNCLNETAYALLLIMCECREFTAEDIARKLDAMLTAETAPEHSELLKDINRFIDVLKDYGWVYVR